LVETSQYQNVNIYFILNKIAVISDLFSYLFCVFS